MASPGRPALPPLLAPGGRDPALADYAAMRRWHVRAYQGMSALFTPMYQSGSRRLPVLRDRLLAPCSTLPLVRGVLTRLVAGTMIPPLAGTTRPRCIDDKLPHCAGRSGSSHIRAP